MKKLILAFVAALLVAPSAAMAADMPAEPVPSFSWTGAYVGLQAAYHRGRIKDTGCTGLCIENHKVKDPFLAVVAGADYQFDNNVVLGVLGGLGVTPIKSKAELIPGFDIKGKTTFGGMIGARAGYAFDRLLPYVFGGYQVVRGKVTNEAVGQSLKKTHHGYVLGLGLEYAITDNISVDARYMYSRFKKKSYDFGGGVTRAGEVADTFSIGVNYRF